MKDTQLPNASIEGPIKQLNKVRISAPGSKEDLTLLGFAFLIYQDCEDQAHATLYCYNILLSHLIEFKLGSCMSLGILFRYKV